MMIRMSRALSLLAFVVGLGVVAGGQTSTYTPFSTSAGVGGLIPIANIATGTCNSGVFVRGDGTCAVSIPDADKGDITTSASGATWTIDAGVVTHAKYQDVAANTVLARAAGTTGSVSAVALSASQLLGRGSTGDVAAIGLGTGLAISGTTISRSEIANANTADVALSGNSDQYLTGSSLAIGGKLKAGSTLRWFLGATKTAAGTATGVCKIHWGTAGTTADTVRNTLTFGGAQTAATDTAQITIVAVIRSVSATGTVSASLGLTKAAAATAGFVATAATSAQSTSATFDNSGASLIAGVSCNPGASGAWTFQTVSALAFNLQ